MKQPRPPTDDAAASQNQKNCVLLMCLSTPHTMHAQVDELFTEQTKRGNNTMSLGAGAPRWLQNWRVSTLGAAGYKELENMDMRKLDEIRQKQNVSLDSAVHTISLPSYFSDIATLTSNLFTQLIDHQHSHVMHYSSSLRLLD